MPSALSIIGAAALLAVGGSGVWAYDRHAPLSWHAHVLFWNPGIDLPGGPIVVADAQRDAALAASRMAQDGQRRCDASLAVQSASVAQVSTAGAAAVARAQAELDATRGENARLRAAQVKLGIFKLTPGQTECQHWTQADGAVIAALMEGK